MEWDLDWVPHQDKFRLCTKHMMEHLKIKKLNFIENA